MTVFSTSCLRLAAISRMSFLRESFSFFRESISCCRDAFSFSNEALSAESFSFRSSSTSCSFSRVCNNSCVFLLAAIVSWILVVRLWSCKVVAGVFLRAGGVINREVGSSGDGEFRGMGAYAIPQCQQWDISLLRQAVL